MSVKTASWLVSRVMRVAIKEAISPANQGTRTSTRRPLSEVGDVNRQFGQELHQRLNAYTGSVDEFGCPGNTVDSWRSQFSQREGVFDAANTEGDVEKRQGQG
ncbi:MAG: hypothetical protein ACR2RE_13660 [Geminicoccaceae bacterium]